MAIVRCWNDDETLTSFRAHVTQVHDVETPETAEDIYAVDTESVVDRVRELLAEFTARPSPGESRNDLTPG
jgi:hypothetical protein